LHLIADKRNPCSVADVTGDFSENAISLSLFLFLSHENVANTREYSERFRFYSLDEMLRNEMQRSTSHVRIGAFILELKRLLLAIAAICED